MAIAFDTSVDGNFSAGTTHTYSHTCTGSDRILFVQAVNNSTSDLLTGITYNGVAMTFISKGNQTNSRYVYLYYLIAPASGANNVVITLSGSGAPGGNSASYTGAKQSAQPDAVQSQLIQAATVNNIVNTVANNCWAVLVTATGGDTPVASTNSVERESNTTFSDAKFLDNNGAITPAGNYTMTMTTNNTGTTRYLQASFAPSIPPAVVKTINGISLT